ncbi:MAG: DUF2314 domain-containing protein [Lentisphaeria bacterium]
MKYQVVIYATISLMLTFGCYKRKSSYYTTVAAYTSTNEAAAGAKATLDDFVRVFHAREPGTKDFCVKKTYIGGSGGEEHCWIRITGEQSGVFQGVVNSHTEHTQGEVKLGQEVSVKKNDISDWKYKDGNKLIGGYTLRYYIDNMPPQERAILLKKVGFEAYGVRHPNQEHLEK